MTLSILSYNILYGGEDRLPLIADIIQKQQPGVVALLEANSHANAEALARQLGMDLTFGEANSEFHVAWLSRLPVIRAENYRLPVFTKTLLKIEILLEEAPLALFATHLRAGRDQESDQYRVTEMQAILDILQPLGNQPHVLVGDLNALHPTDHPNLSTYLVTEPEERGENLQEAQLPRQVIPLLLEAGYIDCYRALHPTMPGYTYKLPDPALRLDYIFASPPLARRLHTCNVVTGAKAEMASDHFPIWAEFGDEVARI
jgi:endonuclease/exonuclease/phosphatase family metal-dependent hydrolase